VAGPCDPAIDKEKDMRVTRLLTLAVSVVLLGANALLALSLPPDLDYEWDGTIINPGSQNPIIEWRWIGPGEAPDPVTGPDAQKFYTFPNLKIEKNVKKLYILVTWPDIQTVPPLPGAFEVVAAGSTVTYDGAEGNMGLLNLSNQFLLKYTIDPQPENEKIKINDFNWTALAIGTRCIPEPATLGLLLLGACVAGYRRR